MAGRGNTATFELKVLYTSGYPGSEYCAEGVTGRQVLSKPYEGVRASGEVARDPRGSLCIGLRLNQTRFQFLLPKAQRCFVCRHFRQHPPAPDVGWWPSELPSRDADPDRWSRRSWFGAPTAAD